VYLERLFHLEMKKVQMAKNYKKTLGIAALLLSFCQLSIPLTIIFDLGGVAVHTSHAAAFKESGIQNYLRFLVRNPHKILMTMKWWSMMNEEIASIN
jgi:hypothetical protein